MTRCRGLGGLVLALALLAPGCGVDEAPLQAVAGTWRLDRRDYASRLLDARVRQGRRHAPEALDANARAKLAEACRALAADLQLSLQLSEDGLFVVRLRAGKEESRYGGTWTRAGNQFTFETTQSPTGRVTTVEPVEAVLTAEGLLFSGWLVPQDFLLRRDP